MTRAALPPARRAALTMAVALALGLFTATRVEMYLRAKRMLAEARRPAMSG